jgi:endonuclease/exonuclease/phosphatase family metal-dependent hydrolase
MTRNIYLGGDISLLLGAESLPDALARAAYVWQTVVATDFEQRAGALADEIAAERPDLVGLQEVALWRIEIPSDELVLVGGNLVPVDGFAPDATQVAYDFLAILLDALAARGLHYELVSSVQNADRELPIPIDPANPFALMDVRFTDHDVILARGDKPGLHTSNPQGANFEASLAVTIANAIPVTLLRGWTSIDVKYRGETFRFFDTHPEAFSDDVTFAQMTELADLVDESPYPVILVGDLNAEPFSLNYLALVNADVLTDAWVALHGPEGGVTCCQLPTLTNPESLLASRIDYVLFGGAFEPLLVDVVGDEALEPPLDFGAGLPGFGPFMYWPSDHAGVVAELRITKEKFVAR